MRKLDFCLCENKGADQLCSVLTAQLIIAYIFATLKVLSILLLNLKFQASDFLICLCRLVYVRSGQNPLKAGFLTLGLICLIIIIIIIIIIFI